MLNYVELGEFNKDVLYLANLGKFFKSRGVTLRTATQEDYYAFINKEEGGKTDYYTQKPVPINYTEGMQKIHDLVEKYTMLKVALELLLENEVI